MSKQAPATVSAAAAATSTAVPPPPRTPAPRILPRDPQPAYTPADPSAPSPLEAGSAELYVRIAGAGRTLVSQRTVALRTAEAFHVRAGQVFRLTTPEGAQVGDLNVWSARDPRERFWAARTRQLHAAHLTVGHRLWSCLPFLRPLATITADSLGGGSWGAGPPPPPPSPEKGEEEEEVNSTTTTTTDNIDNSKVVGSGIAGCHDLLGTRCDPYANTLLSSTSFDLQCHSNLVRAVLPHGLEERDVHDVLNVFQLTGLDARGRYWMGTSPARPGDFLEFFAETDLLCALSACPGGDLSKFGWTGGGGDGGSAAAGDDKEEKGEEDDVVAEEKNSDPMLETCKPLGIEIYELNERDELLKDWKEPERPQYSGFHGIITHI